MNPQEAAKRLRKAEAELQRAQKHHDGSIKAGQRLLGAWLAVKVARALVGDGS